MNEEEEYIDERNITPQSGVRLSVGLIAAMVFAFAYFLYARDDYFVERNETRFSSHETHVGKEIASIKEDISKKADSSQTGDRFTGKDFETFKESNDKEIEQLKESIEQQLELIQEKNAAQHEALESRIDHTREDLKDAVQRIDNHYNIGVNRK